MSNLFVWREQLQNLYARYTIIINKGLQFILAFFTFFFINSKVGFMKSAASPLITFALAVICTFLPLVFTVIMSTALMLLHMYELSIGVLAVSAAIYLIMFILYFRFTSRDAIVVLLMPLAFFMKIPYIIPIAYGLIGTPVCIVPIAFGTIVYFMVNYIKLSATAITGTGDMLLQITSFVRQILQNKELWLTIIAFTICILTVYAIHRMSIDHAWTIAIIAGAIVNIVIMSAGAIVMDVKLSYGGLFLGSILSVIAAMVLELFVFAVDYSRAERLQYEDDEYYYYVKAIPKIYVAAPEKRVKRINERQPTELIDTDEVRMREQGRRRQAGSGQKKMRSSSQTGRNRNGQYREARENVNPDTILLEKSLRDELNL